MNTGFLFAAIGISILAVIVIGGVTVLSSVFKRGASGEAGGAKTEAKDIFIYLGIAITLIISVVNLIQIVFTAIDIKWADTTKLFYSYDIYNDEVRMAIASLVVLYPLYILFSWLASKDVARFPYKKELLVRKATVYTALFVTACTIIGTIISLIYTYLGGDLSTRFGMKAAFIAILSFAIFGYYYYLLKRDFSQASKTPLLIIIVATLGVVASVVWSISMIGGPSEIRMRKVDDQRLQNLSTIQQQVYNYFQNTTLLPKSLDDLNNAIQGFVVPTDPKTKADYEYRVIKQGTVVTDPVTRTRTLTSPAEFELCAVFETERIVDDRGYPVQDGSMYSVRNYYYPGESSPFWNHGEGRECFKRVISNDMYYGGKF